MQSVSSAHSATNSPRFFVGGSRHGRSSNRWVFYFLFFLGKFRFWEEKVSPHGWIIWFSELLLPCPGEGSTPTIYRSLTPTGSLTGMTGMTGTPVSSSRKLRCLGRELRFLGAWQDEAEIHWDELKILGCWKKHKNKLTSQQKLENCLQFWDNLSIIANYLIGFLLCFMFSLGK